MKPRNCTDHCRCRPACSVISSGVVLSRNQLLDSLL